MRKDLGPCLCDVSHKDYINRDSKEEAYSQIDLLMSDKYDISREDYKSNRRRRHLKRSGERYVFIYMHCAKPWGRENVIILAQTSSEVSLFIDAFVAHLSSATMFPCLATGAAKHFVCFPGNTTRNKVSATMFPSGLARP